MKANKVPPRARIHATADRSTTIATPSKERFLALSSEPHQRQSQLLLECPRSAEICADRPITNFVTLLICRIQNLLRHSEVVRHNSTTLNECYAMKRFLLMILGLGLNAVPAIAAAPCVEVTPPPNIPIVKQYSDLQRFDGQIVILTGQYQKVQFGPPLMMTPLEQLTIPNAASNSPIAAPRSNGFANIVLNQGWAIPITPRGKHSLRTAAELAKYATQPVQIQGRARWWGGNNPRSAAGINIYLMRLACVPPVMTPIAPLTTPTFQPDIPLDITP
jgi:hypothetical protein